jgi:tripeptide aminopeptidase
MDIEQIIADNLAICAVSAPTGHEEARAREMMNRLGGIAGIRPMLDGHGNVVARIHGTAPVGPPVIVAAHLDTVFGPEVWLEPRRVGDRLLGPGIGDNSVALAMLLALARELSVAPPLLDIILAANVGEEGLGNLKGARGLLLDHPAACFVALEGHGVDELVVGAVGSVRLEVACDTPGGHSWRDRGAPSAVHELARAVTGLAYGLPPSVPGCSVNVGTITGGTGINVIASHASFQLDIRAVDAQVLDQAEKVGRAIVQATPSHEQVRFTIREIGRRPAGALDPGHPLIALAQAARAASGLPPAELVDGSTDANAAFERGLPGITVGLTRGGNVHREDEYIEIEPLAQGTAAALAFIVSLGAAPFSV